MIMFSELIDELISNIKYNRDILYAFSKNNPNLLYKKLIELASFTGSRHHVTLQLHFPDPKKIKEIDSYGTENISVVIEKFRKKFTIPKENIVRKAIDFLGDNVQFKTHTCMKEKKVYELSGKMAGLRSSPAPFIYGVK